MTLATQETFLVPDGQAPQRLDVYLTRLHPHYTRARLQRLIREGQVRVNDRQEKAGYRVRPQDVIRIAFPPPEPSDLKPEPLPLDILYEDDHLLVIDKPAGLVMHPGAGARQGTLVNALLAHLQSLEGVGQAQRPGIVHRLDRFTSGLVVVAKTPEALDHLARQFKSRTVRKEYLALVYGNVRHSSGRIDLPIGRHPVKRTQMMAGARDGREAITEYSVEERVGEFTLLRVRTRTGRTHQIRVHLSHLGHPLVGDLVYGGQRRKTLGGAARTKAVEGLGRVFLHATSLELSHPETEEHMVFHSPLPPELKRLLGLLR